VVVVTAEQRLGGGPRAIVVAIKETDPETLSDVLLAGALARSIGAELVIVSTLPRWDDWLRWVAVASFYACCPAPRADLVAAQDDLPTRIADLMDLVGTPWRLVSGSGSPRRAAERVARRLPGCLVFYPECAGGGQPTQTDLRLQNSRMP
jgi:hypothetical protein